MPGLSHDTRLRWIVLVAAADLGLPRRGRRGARPVTRMAERLLSEMTPALLRPGGLQDLAAAALERTLAADPDDAHALWKLAEVHRRRGDFAAARGLYRRLRVRGPDRRKAAWLHRVLGGDAAGGGAGVSGPRRSCG